jgi:hypothetical protein
MRSSCQGLVEREPVDAYAQSELTVLREGPRRRCRFGEVDAG